MAPPTLSTRVLDETFAALKRCDWHQGDAARELGLQKSAIFHRVRMLRERGWHVPSFAAPGGPAKSKELPLSGQLKEERQRVKALEEENARLRAARVQPIPRPKVRRREKEDRVIVVWPDLHGARQDPGAVAAFLGDVKKLQPDRGVSLGDLLDCGGYLAQHHVLGFVAETAESWEEDVEAGGKFLNAVQEAATFPEGLDWIEGNHEHRVEKLCVTTALRSSRDAKALLERESPATRLRVKERGIRYYRRAETYDGMPVQGAFRIGRLGLLHGFLRGNSTPDRVVARMGGNAMYGHTHRIASRITRTGQGTVGAWNIGTLARLQMHYQHSDPTDHAHGYAVVDMARSGAFQVTQVLIVDGVSLLAR